jgi:hypothetical protein
LIKECMKKMARLTAIAAVAGACVGAGLGFALACDPRVFGAASRTLIEITTHASPRWVIVRISSSNTDRRRSTSPCRNRSSCRFRRVRMRTIADASG